MVIMVRLPNLGKVSVELKDRGCIYKNCFLPNLIKIRDHYVCKIRYEQKGCPK